MSGLARATLAALLALALVANHAAASNETAETALLVSADNPSVSGTIVGNKGGAYRYYQFAYPGANVPVQIHLTWNPGFASTGRAFGFNVYGPNGFVGEGIRGDDAGEASTANLSLAAPTPGTYLVQVYSYTADTVQNFAVDFAGLGPAPTPVADNVVPERAVSVQQQTASLGGALTGRSAGAFNFFLLGYPGGQWPMTVSLSFTPASALPVDAFGFNLYDEGNLAGTGVEVARSGETATKTLTISSVAPGTYGLQVYNYADGVTGSYVVGVDGAVGTVVGVTGNGTPDRAVRLTPQAASARGTIVGNAGGAFAFFGLEYQGNNEPITLSLPFKPGPGLTGSGVGLNLYRGSDLVATSARAGGRTAEDGIAYLTYSSDQAGYYGVQVYNYAPGITVEYTLHAMGLKR